MITEQYLIIFGVRCPVLGDYHEKPSQVGRNVSMLYDDNRIAHREYYKSLRGYNPNLKICLNPFTNETFIGHDATSQPFEHSFDNDVPEDSVSRRNPDDVYVRTINSLYKNRVKPVVVKEKEVKQVKFPVIGTIEELKKHLEM